MIPVVALVGRHNVGKSTIFNRLTRTRDALVVDFPGLTRDRNYGRAEVEGREFIVIDTGGIDGKEDGIEMLMAEQSLLAIEEADIVLFIVDAHDGRMPGDSLIAKYLRSRKKVTFLVVNKIDGLNTDNAIVDFYTMGLSEIYLIAALHGRGLTSLLKMALLPWIEKTMSKELSSKEAHDYSWTVLKTKEYRKDCDIKIDNSNQNTLPVKIAIVGRPNVGKSTLTNRILGEDRMVVYETPGTTRDSIYIPMKYGKREYILIDTAGIRKRYKAVKIVEKFSVIKTLQAIENANVVLLVIDARHGIVDQDLSILDFILNIGCSLLIIFNKWDELSQKMKNEIKKNLNFRLNFINFVRIHFISARHINNGIGNLFKSINEAYDCSTRRISASMLTRIMNTATEDYQPPLMQRRRAKLKYAHVVGYNPPIVVIHGSHVKDLPDSYKRYLINYFHRSLNMMGTPIHIQFKEGENPFVNKRNPLMLNHQYKRNRLI